MTTAVNTAANTADRDEVARFAALADSWWDSEGEFSSLHQINPPRLTFIRDQLCIHFGRDSLAARPLDGLSIVDVGCGGGLICEPLARMGATVTGIDAAEEGINVARHHARSQGLDIDYRSALPEDLAEDLAGGGAVYDALINMEVIEHVTDAAAFMAACAGLVRSGGAMAASTLNRTLKSLALAKFGAEYVLRWVPPGTHDWRKFLRPSELAVHLRGNGFDIRKIEGIRYNPFTGEWSLAGDLDINYLMFAVKR